MLRFALLPPLFALLVSPSPLAAQARALDLRLPTENTALLTGQGADYFQFVDREFEGQRTTPWEGGQFGFVRDPRRIAGGLAYARFHEGMDVKPLRRDPAGEPLDEVCAILPGEVVYVTATAAQSNYGRYLVVKHDWGEGPFFSLYAHLKEARVAAGQKVAAGAVVGRMGYTGSGIDRRRAHLHVELNLLLNSNFETWHATNFRTPNHHGIYNGLNLLGLNLQDLYAAHQKNPALSVAKLVRDTEASYEITVPGKATMEIAKRYRWLGDETLLAVEPPSWQVRCNRWGLPVSVKPGAKPVWTPQVTWIKPDPMPHYYTTRGIVTGSGSTGKLTVEGLRFIQLLCGLTP